MADWVPGNSRNFASAEEHSELAHVQNLIQRSLDRHLLSVVNKPTKIKQDYVSKPRQANPIFYFKTWT